jgi:hypothetical protein
LSLFLAASSAYIPGADWRLLRSRARAQSRRARAIRSQGPDYLAYRLLDSLVIPFSRFLETYGETLERHEQTILARPDESAIASLHAIKRDLLSCAEASGRCATRSTALPHRNGFVRHEIHPTARLTRSSAARGGIRRVGPRNRVEPDGLLSFEREPPHE